MFAADDGGCMCTSRAVLSDYWPPAVCDQVAQQQAGRVLLGQL
jgi:hypothetical protein